MYTLFVFDNCLKLPKYLNENGTKFGYLYVSLLLSSIMISWTLCVQHKYYILFMSELSTFMLLYKIQQQTHALNSLISKTLFLVNNHRQR